nr:DUF6443 domain-containing protein [uncultured Flavobacterium sp.]
MKNFTLLVFVLFPVLLLSQSQTENYIKTTTYKVESTTSITTPTALQASQNITYFDGLGRPVQQVAHQQSSTGKDIVTPIEYDAFGRQAKDYLPYVPTVAASLDYKTTALTEVGTFYNTAKYENTTNPFSQKEFEASPLNRVLKQAAPGEDWKLGNGHEIRFDYQTNTDTDKVRRFGVSFIAGNTENPYLEDEGIYDSSQLYKTITKDENWTLNQAYPDDHTTQEFKDKEGRIVLKRTFDANKWHDTYYVYDDFGNLTYVLPPKTTTYSNIGQQFQNQEIYLDNYTDGANFFINDGYFSEISMYESNGKLECYFYAEYFFEEILKSGKIADLNFTPALPNMILGDIMMYNLKGEPIVAGTAYIRDGDLYFDSTGSIVYTNASNYSQTHFSIDLADYQNNFTIPFLDRQTFNDLIYQYRYDNRNRLVEKKLPGKEWEYIIYDKLDRPILTQDANLKASNKWLFTKYDVFSRPVYTGEYTNTLKKTRADIQLLADTSTTLSETKQAVNTINNTVIYYSNTAFPNANDIDLFTINYYDNYDFDLNGGNSVTSYGIIPITNAKGLATGSKVRILGTSSWITSLIYYDEKGRAIYNYSKNDYLSTTSTVKKQLDFIGKILEIKYEHLRNSIATSIVDTFIYDHAERLTKQTQSINGTAAPEVILENAYDELGQLIQKKVGGKSTQNRLQIIDYTYNIRGWLKGINDSDTNYLALTLGSGDLFGFQINYNKPSSRAKKLYNGNISETYWKTNTTMKTYDYTYDALNRIKKANYSQNHDYGNYKFNETVNNYDRNGNILSLFRYILKNRMILLYQFLLTI